MKNKKMLPVLILCLLGILYSLYVNIAVIASETAGGSETVTAWLLIFALLAAGVYIVMGYTKEAAFFYQIFLYAFALAQLAGVVDAAVQNSDPMRIAVAAAVFGFVFLLAMSKDLGKVKSYVLCACVLGVSLLFLILSCFAGTKGIGALTVSPEIGRGISLTVLSAVMWLMVAAKYADKAARGRE